MSSSHALCPHRRLTHSPKRRLISRDPVTKVLLPEHDREVMSPEGERSKGCGGQRSTGAAVGVVSCFLVSHPSGAGVSPGCGT